MADIGQASAAFTNISPFASQQAQQGQQTNQEERDQTERATANPAAATSAQPTQLVAAQPNATPNAATEENRAVSGPAGETSQSNPARTGAQGRGTVLDITV